VKPLAFIVLLAAAGYFAAQNWPAVTSALQGSLPQTGAVNPAAALFETPSWGEREVAGLRLNLPCSLDSYNPGQTGPIPANIHVEFLRGRAGDSKFYVSHFTNSALVGGVMLTWADKPLGAVAEKIKLNVISTNSATTIIGGMRARRSDYISASGNPRTRVRCLLLERGNRIWLVECHAPESNTGAEDVFLKIARSAQEL